MNPRIFYIAGGPVLMVLVPNGQSVGPPRENSRYLAIIHLA